MSQNVNAQTGQPKRIAAALTDAEIEAVDAWGFARRIRNRSDAIKALIAVGLKATAGETP